MKKKDFLEIYDVSFVNLKPGKHNYDFQVDHEFFEFYEESLVKEVNAEVNLVLDKQSDYLFVLDFKLKGSMDFVCDRCLSKLQLPVQRTHRMVLKIVPDKDQEEFEDDIIYASMEDYKINVADSIYEFFNMEVPMRKTCEMINTECDSKILDAIDQVNDIESELDIDPRWNDLKNLKKN